MRPEVPGLRLNSHLNIGANSSGFPGGAAVGDNLVLEECSELGRAVGTADAGEKTPQSRYRLTTRRGGRVRSSAALEEVFPVPL